MELAAGTHLLIQDGDRLVLFSAFGINWDDYLPYAAQVETIFESIAFTSDRDGHGATYIMDSDGAEQTWLVDATGVRFVGSEQLKS
jgi:hypothetical protein